MREAFGSSQGKVLEDLRGTCTQAHQGEQVQAPVKRTGTQLARNLYVRFALIVQPSHLDQLPITSRTPWLSKEWCGQRHTSQGYEVGVRGWRGGR